MGGTIKVLEGSFKFVGNRCPFEVVGVDFAGPIKYRKTPQVEGKAYLVLYAA